MRVWSVQSIFWYDVVRARNQMVACSVCIASWAGGCQNHRQNLIWCGFAPNSTDEINQGAPNQEKTGA